MKKKLLLFATLLLSLALAFALIGCDGTNENGTGTGGTGTEQGSTDEPGSGTDEPGSGTDEPGSGTDEPGSDTDEPGSGTDEPGSDTDDPGGDTDEPGENPGGEQPGGETTYTVTESEWNAALSEERFANVRFLLTATSGSMSMKAKSERRTEGDTLYIKSDIPESAPDVYTTYYYEIAGDAAYEYLLYEEHWVKQRTSADMEFSSAYFFWLEGCRTEGLAYFTYDETAHCYTAEKVVREEGNIGVEATDVKLYFENGVLAYAECNLGNIPSQVEFTGYGEVNFDMPANATEIPAGSIDDADEVTAEEWNAALSEDSFSNVSVRTCEEFTTIDGTSGSSLVLYSIERSQSDGVSLTLQTSPQGEQHFATENGTTYLYTPCEDGSWIKQKTSEKSLFDADILPLLQALRGRFANAQCGPTDLYAVGNVDAGSLGVLYDATVRFLDGRLVEIKGFAEPESPADGEMISIQFENYGSTQINLPDGDEVFSDEDWDALFSDEGFSNLSVSISGNGQSVTVEHAEEGGIPLTHEVIDGVERYFRTEDNVTWIYTLQDDGSWLMTPETDQSTQDYLHSAYFQAKFVLRQLAGQFGRFTYKAKIFTADEVLIDMGGGTGLPFSCRVTVLGNGEYDITLTYAPDGGETQIMEFLLSDFGQTSVTLPENAEVYSPYTVTAEDWDIAFSAANLGNATIAIEQGGKVLMNVNNMFDTEPGIVYSETHREGETSRLYYVQYENGVLLYSTDQSGEWNTPQFAPYPMEQSLYWLAGFVGIFDDAVYSETENAYIVENFDFSQYGAAGTLKAYFEDGFVQKVTVDAGDEAQNVVITFENYGDTQVELPADLPEYVPEAA